MSGDAAHPPSRGIMHHAAQQVVVFIFLGRRNARFPGRGRQEPSLFHAERSKHVLRRIFVKRLARQLLDQRSQHHEVNIAVQK